MSITPQRYREAGDVVLPVSRCPRTHGPRRALGNVGGRRRGDHHHPVGERGLHGQRPGRSRERPVRAAALAHVAGPPVPAVPRPGGARPVVGHRRQRPLGRDERRPPHRAGRLLRHRPRVHAIHQHAADSTAAAARRPRRRAAGGVASTPRRWACARTCSATRGSARTAGSSSRWRPASAPSWRSTSSASCSTTRRCSALPTVVVERTQFGCVCQPAHRFAQCHQIHLRHVVAQPGRHQLWVTPRHLTQHPAEHLANEELGLRQQQSCVREEPVELAILTQQRAQRQHGRPTNPEVRVVHPTVQMRHQARACRVLPGRRRPSQPAGRPAPTCSCRAACCRATAHRAA